MGPHRRTLLLLRHAKSSWGKADVTDLERPLSPRGQRAAAAVGQWIGQRGLTPDRVLCSPARRSQETLALVRRQLPGAAPTVSLEASLYEGDAAAIVAAVAAGGAGAERLLVVAHAPGVAEAALALAGSGAGDTLSRVGTHFPTAGLAQLGVDAPWEALGPGQAYLEAFVVPKELV